MAEVRLALLALLCFLSAWTDWRTRTIPNWLTVPAWIAGFLVTPWPDALQGAAVALLISFPFFLLRYTSGGDVKLMAALGALFGLRDFLLFFVFQALLGGVAAVALAIRRGRLKETVKRLFHHGAKPMSVDDPRALTIPRGVIVAAGFVLWCLT